MITNIELKDVLKVTITSCNITAEEYRDTYRTIDQFADYTKEVIKSGNLSLACECFSTANYLLSEGNREIKILIENVYIASLSTFLNINATFARQVKNLLPARLLDLFKKRINGIF